MLYKNCAIGLFANCSAKSKQIVYTQTTERMSCRLSLLLQIARVWVCMCVCVSTRWKQPNFIHCSFPRKKLHTLYSSPSAIAPRFA